METDFGEKKLGARRCGHCQAEGWRCLVYSVAAKARVLNCDDACARCRARPSRYSISTKGKGPGQRLEAQPKATGHMPPLAPDKNPRRRGA